LQDPDEPDWTELYDSTGGAAYVGRRKMFGLVQQMHVMLDWYQLVYSYGLDPYIVHRAFLLIDEYQTVIKNMAWGQLATNPATIPASAMAEPILCRRRTSSSANGGGEPISGQRYQSPPPSPSVIDAGWGFSPRQDLLRAGLPKLPKGAGDAQGVLKARSHSHIPPKREPPSPPLSHCDYVTEKIRVDGRAASGVW
jgi:hypothetical protein